MRVYPTGCDGHRSRPLGRNGTKVVEGVISIPLHGSSTKPGSGSPRTADAPRALREFLVGPENALVPVVLESVLDGTPHAYSPIVLFGPSGTGKSHLALGLVSLWKSRFRGRPAVYATAVDFARSFGDAQETQSVEDFRARYRQAALLVLDDVHHLAPKPIAQRELIATLDAIHASGNRVVLTASTAPEQLVGFLPALQSRLLGGLAVPLALPSLPTRLAVLERFARHRRTDLPSEVARILAEKLRVPVSALLGAVVQLDTEAQADGRTIDVESVRRFLSARNTNGPSLSDITALTARHFSVKVTELRSPSRSRAVVTARGVAMYLARTLTHKSLDQIGHYFDGRDHTTVSYGCTKTKDLLKSDPAIRTAVELLCDRLSPSRTPAEKAS
jgi:chromosomal replication initiator protein